MSVRIASPPIKRTVDPYLQFIMGGGVRSLSIEGRHGIRTATPRSIGLNIATTLF